MKSHNERVIDALFPLDRSAQRCSRSGFGSIHDQVFILVLRPRHLLHLHERLALNEDPGILEDLAYQQLVEPDDLHEVTEIAGGQFEIFPLNVRDEQGPALRHLGPGESVTLEKLNRHGSLAARKVYGSVDHGHLSRAEEVGKGSPHGEIVHPSRQLGAEIPRFRTVGATTAPEHGTLSVAETGAAGALLGTNLTGRAGDFGPRLAGGGALTQGVTFKDDGSVEDVFAQREVQELLGDWDTGVWDERGKGVSGDVCRPRRRPGNRGSDSRCNSSGAHHGGKTCAFGSEILCQLLTLCRVKWVQGLMVQHPGPGVSARPVKSRSVGRPNTSRYEDVVHEQYDATSHLGPIILHWQRQRLS